MTKSPHGGDRAASAAPRIDDPLLDADAVAALLNVSRRWVYDHVRSGDLDTVRLGRRLRFRRDIVEWYVHRQSTSDPLGP